MDHIERRHSIALTGSIDRVFPLFTPIGETLWVDGWNPEFLLPKDGETREGMIFRTGAGKEETLWTCTEWNPGDHRVRYARVTPGSRFGFVEVKCREGASGNTEASVEYSFTALTEKGRSYLAELTEEAFARMIEEWRVRINQWLLSDGALQAGRRG
jgi:hypothetical protein